MERDRAPEAFEAGDAPTALIGVDWGTTNLRVLRFDAEGIVRDRREAPQGVTQVAADGFEAALAPLLAGWGPAPILLCGMVGSRQGWAETPYLPCPVSAPDLASALRPVESALGEVWILCGVTSDLGAGRCDVMRGEEVQILGAAPATGAARIIAPGTHSKWATVRDGRLTDFRTFMTGELYALLSVHSTLGRLMSGRDHDPEAFAKGLALALADPSLGRLLFSVRTEGLFDRIAPTALAAYLSGLLIGAEIAAGLDETVEARGGAVMVIADPVLANLYRQGLAAAGVVRVSIVDGGDAVAAGLWRLAAGRLVAA